MTVKRTTRNLLPPHIEALASYVPGRPIEEVERELGRPVVKLASNENPLGPSPRALEVIRGRLEAVNRYPDAGGTYLREKLAARLDVGGVGIDNIVLGNGSTELIQLLCRMVLHEGCGLTSEGTFVMFPLSVSACGAECILTPHRNFAFDLDAIPDAATEDVRLVYFANPNNPTGSLFKAAELEKTLDRLPDHCIVILDEAYFEYVDDPDYSRSVELVRDGRPVLVLRTFSKIYGLAGMRIGYGIGHPDIIRGLNRVRSPFNYSVLALAAAEAALDDAEHVRRSLESNRTGLAFLQAEFAKLGFTVPPAHANFVYMETGYQPQAVAKFLLSRGVIVRPLGFMGMPRGLRVTVGTAEENLQAVEVFAQLDGAGLPGVEGGRRRE